MGLTSKLECEQPWTPELVVEIGGGLLIFSMFTLGLMASLIYTGKVKPPEGDGQWLVRLIVVPLCVLSAVFLVVFGFSDQQISPVVGLLGAIIGYLLGAGTRPSNPPAPSPKDVVGTHE
jgi:hypothetical protein